MLLTIICHTAPGHLTNRMYASYTCSTVLTLCIWKSRESTSRNNNSLYYEVRTWKTRCLPFYRFQIYTFELRNFREKIRSMKHIAGVSNLFYLEIPKTSHQKYSCMLSCREEPPQNYNFYYLLIVTQKVSIGACSYHIPMLWRDHNFPLTAVFHFSCVVRKIFR